MVNKSTGFTVILLTAAFLLFARSARAGLLYGPYLQSLEPDTMAICAVADHGDRLSVRLEGGKENQEVNAEGEQPSCARFSGLSPDVGYHYTLWLNGQRLTKDPSPAFVASTTSDLTFVVLGDTRAGEDSFDLSHRAIVKSVEKTVVPDGILHTGDFVERGNASALWVNYFRLESELLANAPIFPAIGQSDQPAYLMRKLFPVLGHAPYYSFTHGPAHFVVLNLWQTGSQKPAEVSGDGEQARWLREDLARARSEEGVRYLFAVLHEPAIGIDGKIPPAIRDVFMPIFEAFHVIAVFSGAHYFSHTVKNGVHYITNGGGGAVLETQSPAKGTFLFFQAVHHFIVLEIDPARARIRAVNENGAVFYSASLAESSSSSTGQASPTFVESYHGGARTVPITVFFREGCGDCESFKAELPNLARQANVTVVATFRTLTDPENRAMLKSLTEREGPTPIVSIGDEILVGLKETGPILEQALRMAASRDEKHHGWSGRWIAAGAAVVALALLIGIFVGRIRQRARNR